MAFLSKVENGNVIIIHHSTSSVIEIQIAMDVVNEAGDNTVDIDKVLLDYKEFAELKEAMRRFEINP